MRNVFFYLILMFPTLVLADNPVVVMQTNMGNITLELDAEKAPVTVKNFLSYVDIDGYAGSIFHRVISNFMIQAGGHYADLEEMESGDTILNEADNGLKNLTGTIAMARMNQIDSASRQFFINTKDNAFLDHSPASCTREDERKQEAASARGLNRPVSCKSFGYAVFGRVIDGMEVVRKIEAVETVRQGPHQNVPRSPVIIERIIRQ